jgi:hypothetical protein
VKRVAARLTALLLVALVAAPAPAAAWPAELLESLQRDARKMLPRSLAHVMQEREDAILKEMRHFPPEIAQALAADQVRGQLRPETLGVLDARAAAAVALLKKGKVTDGVVAMAGLVRVPADLSDPALGGLSYPPGVLSEYYTFVGGNLQKIPVVLSDPPALQLERKRLPAYWQSMLTSSRAHSDVIRTEMWQGGRVVPARNIDYRNPVFGVASLAYSRAVTGIAATWLAVWREAQGDLTRQPKPRVILARPEPPVAAADVTRETPRNP